ncbi:MAG TPA: hypothetical protein VF158_03305 [Longimicrobiales bacterium]
MHNTIERYSERHRDEALADLRAELYEFSHDGLVQLREDLARSAVVRGSWAGCVISYKRGAPGSTRRDRLGRARNAFTVLWDNGWITDEEVLAMVDLELARRRALEREHEGAGTAEHTELAA